MKKVKSMILKKLDLKSDITKKYQDLSQSINFDGIEDFIKKMSNSFKGRFIFISTCSNYGLIPENDLADENYPLSPLSHYAKCKVLIEEFSKCLFFKFNPFNLI